MNNSLLKHITIYIFLFGIISVFQSCSGCSQSSINSRTKNTSNNNSKYSNKKAEHKPKSEPAIVQKELPPPTLKKEPEEPKSYPEIKTDSKRTVAQMFKELQQGVFMVFAYDDVNKGGAQGSGFFINSTGIGITNYHVLEGFNKYKIKTADGKYYKIVKILESSKSEDNDYVIFQVKDNDMVFKSLQIANVKSAIGEDVFAIGSPKGLENSLTKGTVSQYRRNNRIQIDATVEQGSSGGPLFNMHGEIIGITSSKMKDTDAALNFAVDIQVVPFQQYVKKKVATKNSINSQNHFLLPTSTTDQIIKHTYFTVSFSDDDKQPEWVAYKTTLKNFNNHIKRTNDYRSDPYVKTGSADRYDYYGSGYDMGHLAPARTMSHNDLSMSESFYLSNISPQVPSFNRGIWKKLEAKVRYWTAMNDSLYVVTGPVLKMPIDIIGDNDVTVPRAFYKTLVGFKDGRIKGIAFIMPNQQSKKSIYSYATSIDHVEELTGIDFYQNLNIQVQEEIEANKDIKKWALNN